MNFGVLILAIVIGIIFGIITGALWLVIKVISSQKKALKDFENGKAFEVKENPKEEIKKQKINKNMTIPKPKIETKKNNKSALSKLFGRKK